MVRPRALQGRDAGDCIALAIAKNFEGDAALYDAFAAACTEQFPLDIAHGDAACASGDLAQLQRLAHNLKSALEMLGDKVASELATEAEAIAQTNDRHAAHMAWQALREALATQS